MRNTSLPITLTCLAIVAAAAGAARADTIYLKNGQKYEGAAEEKDGAVVVRLERGSLTFTKEQVDRIEKSPPPWEVYEEKAKALRREDVSGRMDLARWCKAHALPGRMKQELEKVIIADPDNEEARGLLGHKKVGEKWVTPEEQSGKPGPGDPGKGPVGPAGANPPPDGTYRGTSRGNNDDLEVEVVVVLGRITEVKVVEHKEKMPRTAMQDVPARIVDKQSIRVDGLSGATITSNAIRRAATSALATARPVSLAAVPDGTYSGVSRGMKGDLSVQVTVKGGRIADACVTTCNDLQPGTAVKDIPERIKAAQSTQVDAVTGATVTSRAIMRAARNALEGLQPESWAKPPAAAPAPAK